jgi:pantoate kinase
MELGEILATVAKMFPNTNVRDAVEKAQQMLPRQIPNDFKEAQKIAKQIGLDSSMAQSIYERYGKSMQARTICSMFGTTPEALKADAEKLLGAEEENRRFPRLK